MLLSISPILVMRKAICGKPSFLQFQQTPDTLKSIHHFPLWLPFSNVRRYPFSDPPRARTRFSHELFPGSRFLQRDRQSAGTWTDLFVLRQRRDCISHGPVPLPRKRRADFFGLCTCKARHFFQSFFFIHDFFLLNNLPYYKGYS